ncbi:response regulator [Paenibacillus wynnii]|uniref:AraC family transcriptional regulator n=1 Tax=Paenibacillus wynnii TaxID=268407 RepID=A0A098M7U4_9BACL|nr:response regulator [Paenibacillus wynnii]KGE18654.1 AraC family transcriptional regulator [Paenibacillus wynnii]
MEHLKPIKVCVIDDIKSVVDMISRKPQWQEFGIEIVGTALDGEQGLSIIRETLPDIVLTDIRMPRMDGLEMTKAILEFAPLCKIIILSAYSEFSYAQQAIRLGAMDFVKKPFSLDEIIKVVLQAKQICLQDREEQEKTKAMEGKIKESLPILQQEYLTFLMQHQTSEHSAKSRWEYLGIPLALQDFVVFIAEIDHFAEKYQTQPIQEIELVRFSLQNILEETIAAWTSGIIFREATNRYVCVINGSDPEVAEEIIEACCSNVSHYSRNTISIGMGLCVSTIHELANSYGQALSALAYHFYTDGNAAYSYANILKKPRVVSNYSVATEQEFLFALRSGNWEKSQLVLQGIFDELLSLDPLPEPKYVENIGYELSYKICRVMLELFPYEKVQPMEQQVNLLRNRIHPTLMEIRSLLSDLCAEGCRWVEEERSIESTKIIRQAKVYICGNLHTSLSLEQVAKQINLSQGYFSNLFKKVVGTSFQQFVMHEKMEKAKSMLIEGYQVQEIALELGYEHRRYFSDVFKKYTNMTPSEFKISFLGKV